MDCPQLQNGACRIVSDLVGKPINPPPSACKVCGEAVKPQQVNHVTLGLAVSYSEPGSGRQRELMTRHRAEPEVAAKIEAARKPRCVYLGIHLETIDGDLLECRCGDVPLHECVRFGENVVARHLKADAVDLLTTLRPPGGRKAAFLGRTCHGCPEYQPDRPTSRPAPQAARIEPVATESPHDLLQFDRVVCINLDRRPDRWESFQQNLPADWPWKRPERVAAVDGELLRPPSEWKAGKGAWGCYRSHMRIIEECLATGARSVLILEDDAVCVPDFARQAADYLDALPPDWQMAYFGGQHLKQDEHPPRQVNPRVVRPWNVNRTHAYALRGDGLRIVYQWLHSRDWQPEHHVDHHLGRLHESGLIRVYAPASWLIGQAAGHSNISGREAPERFWDPSRVSSVETVQPSHRPIIAVLGPFRSGTSATAGVLHHLGVSMGSGWPRWPGNPKGTFEAPRLAKMVRAWFPEPGCLPQLRENAIPKLRKWLAGRRVSPSGVVGAKHPSLCLMVPDILQAWPGCRFVCVDRPPEESAASILQRRWPGWTPRIAGEVTRRMIRERDAALVDAPAERVFRVDFHRLIEQPEATVDELIRWAGLGVTDDQRAAAIAHVDSKLWRVRK